MTRHLRAAALGLALTVGAAGLAACSGNSSGTTARSTSATSSASATPSTSASAGNRGVFGSAKVQACLKAAGITLPSGRPGGFPSGSRSRPSGTFPSGSRPSFSRPSGAGGAFGGNSAEGQKIQAALKACGITLPTGRGGAPRASATPTASSTG